MSTELLHFLTEVGATLAGLYAILRFVFEPRFTLAMQAEVKPVVERVEKLEHRASATDIKLDGFHDGQTRAEESIERIGKQIGDGLDKLAVAIERLADKHEETAKEVAALKASKGRGRR